MNEDRRSANGSSPDPSRAAEDEGRPGGEAAASGAGEERTSGGCGSPEAAGAGGGPGGPTAGGRPSDRAEEEGGTEPGAGKGAGEAGEPGAGGAPGDGAGARPEPPDGPSEAPRDEEEAGGAGSAMDSLRAQLEAARAEAEAEREAALRAHAETENVRRRAARDVEQAHRFGIEGLVKELLPVRDGLELGIRAAEEEGSTVEALAEGAEMTLRMLTAALEKFGAVEIDPEGEAFDPAYHQAMSMQEVEGEDPGRVLQVFQKGCLLHGRVVRPAMVVVSRQGRPDDGARTA